MDTLFYMLSKNDVLSTVLQGFESSEFWSCSTNSLFHVRYGPRKLLPCLFDQVPSGPVLNAHLLHRENGFLPTY